MIRLRFSALRFPILLAWKLAAAVDTTVDPSLIARLDTAATQLDRLALLPNDADWKFDFKKQEPFYNFAPGGVSNMNAATFPASMFNGLTLAMVNLGPCSQLPPHFHPRAANWVVAVQGKTTTYMFEENGAHTITSVLEPGEATIFPRGSMHMMTNNDNAISVLRFPSQMLIKDPECTDAQLVSALDSEDAGTSNIGNVFTNGFPSDWVNAAFGGDLSNPITAKGMAPIGTGANWGPAECLRRCGITLPNSPSPAPNSSYSGLRLP